MSMFTDYSKQAREIETEIVRKGIILGIDWQDTAAVHALAEEAIAFHHAGETINLEHEDFAARARIELFALAQLMLDVMRESAEEDLLTHGGEIWKTLGQALWQAGGLPPRLD